jgi:hypothetical protein
MDEWQGATVAPSALFGSSPQVSASANLSPTSRRKKWKSGRWLKLLLLFTDHTTTIVHHLSCRCLIFFSLTNLRSLCTDLLCLRI